MTQITTNKDVFSVVLDHDECLIVECKTQGANSPVVGGAKVSFFVGVFMPCADLSGLRIRLPKDKLFSDEDGNLYLMSIPGCPEQIRFGDTILSKREIEKSCQQPL